MSTNKRSLWHRWCWHRAVRRFSRASERLNRAEIRHTDHMSWREVDLGGVATPTGGGPPVAEAPPGAPDMFYVGECGVRERKANGGVIKNPGITIV